MIVKDLVDLDYNLPFVIDGVEYADNKLIEPDILLTPIDRFDLLEDPNDKGNYKVHLTLAKNNAPIMEKGN